MNKLSTHLSKHLREVYFGGNWTSVNLRDSLSGVSWQQAITKPGSLNSILALVYHINYYITAVTRVLQDEPLNASDKFSFDHPAIQSEEDWQNLLNKTWKEAENFADLIEELPDSKLWENFDDGKYGNYYRNIQGIIEHTHYHLGQIVLIKKLIQQPG
jgi:uncharacterized damage-inducible protein DinB